MAGAIILEVLTPSDFKANSSELADNFPQVNNVDNKTDIGKDKTRKLGKLKNKAFKASSKGRPYSTIFLIRSNITPTDKEITVKAEIANNIGGVICPINHLSIRGIEFHGVVVSLIAFLIADCLEIFKRNLFNQYLLIKV